MQSLLRCFASVLVLLALLPSTTVHGVTMLCCGEPGACDQMPESNGRSRWEASRESPQCCLDRGDDRDAEPAMSPAPTWDPRPLEQPTAEIPVVAEEARDRDGCRDREAPSFRSGPALYTLHASLLI